MNRYLAAILAVFVWVSACADDPAEQRLADSGVDAGPVDAGPVDAASGDAGPGDAASGDAASGDAGPVDAGLGDAGPVDAGPGDSGADAADATPADVGTDMRLESDAAPDAETCEPDPSQAELCDGLDNDCDPATPDGADEPWFGEPCDGDDSDMCEEGTTECVAGAPLCSDVSSDTIEFCDGVDNDCDPSTLDGADESMSGMPCDGPDSDLCALGTFMCANGVFECQGDTAQFELCDGVDNDCDPATPDGSDEAWFSTACDGPDSDLCAEGSFGCAGAVQFCSDNTTDNVELCNDTIDNDCDGTVNEGC